MGINFHGEMWRPVRGFEGGYEVSSFGRVRSLPRTRERRLLNGQSLTVTTRRFAVILSQKTNTHGYFEVCLRHCGRQRMAYVQRLVCEAFHGPPPDAKSHAAHINGLRTDNRQENIMWASAKENSSHKTPDENSSGSVKRPSNIHPEKRRAAKLLLQHGFTVTSVKMALSLTAKTVEKVAASLKTDLVSASPSRYASVR